MSDAPGPVTPETPATPVPRQSRALLWLMLGTVVLGVAAWVIFALTGGGTDCERDNVGRAIDGKTSRNCD